MSKQKLGRGLAALAGTAVLATKEAAADDEISAALHIERCRYERQRLDFESEVVRHRDAMAREHVANMRTICGEAG